MNKPSLKMYGQAAWEVTIQQPARYLWERRGPILQGLLLIGFVAGLTVFTYQSMDRLLTSVLLDDVIYDREGMRASPFWTILVGCLTAIVGSVEMALVVQMYQTVKIAFRIWRIEVKKQAWRIRGKNEHH